MSVFTFHTFASKRQHAILIVIAGVVAWCAYLYIPVTAHAQQATLSIVPATAIYPIGEPFTIEVRVDTAGGEVGSADATLAFEPDDLSFVSFSSEDSVFSRIMVDDSRTPGRLDISGFIERSREPYVGPDGLLARVTFMPLRNVATQLRFTQAAATPPLSLTASVGDLTNILTRLSSATYTLVPREVVAPQQVVAATAYASTDGGITLDPAPVNNWIATTTVKASWTLPDGVTSLRTGVSSSSDALPTKVYAVPVSSINLEGLEDGAQFLSVQFNQNGAWGDVLRVPLNIDTTPPATFVIEPVSVRNPEDERLGFYIEVQDSVSSVASYTLQIDGGDPIAWERTEEGIYRPDGVTAGEHVLTVTANDSASNSASQDHVFTVDTIEAPVLTEVPERVLTGDVISVKGTTYPDSEVTVYVSFNDGEASERNVRSDANGAFTATLTDGARAGKYTVWFSVVDPQGAKSSLSIKRSIEVSQPFIMLFGKTAVTYLSVIVPLIALILVLGLVLWLGYAYVRGYRKHVRTETNEAYAIVREEFDALRKELTRQIGALEKANQSRELTREEMRIFTELSKRLEYIESHIEQEIDDIETVQVPQDVPEGVGHDTLAKYQQMMARTGTEGATVVPARSMQKNDTVAPRGRTVRVERVN